MLRSGSDVERRADESSDVLRITKSMRAFTACVTLARCNIQEKKTSQRIRFKNVEEESLKYFENNDFFSSRKK